MLIIITPRAAEQIRKSAQAGDSHSHDMHLRIAARLDEKGVIEYGMGFDTKAGDDTQVMSEGITLLISPGSVELLTGATLDFVDLNPGEQRYIFINPNDPSHKAPKPAH